MSRARSWHPGEVVGADDYLRRQSIAMSEDALQQSIADLCGLLNLPYYHTHDSRRSPEGFPDSAIVRGDTLLLFESKTERGKATPAQLRWLDALGQVRRVESGIWRPTDWLSGAIERQLLKL